MPYSQLSAYHNLSGATANKEGIWDGYKALLDACGWNTWKKIDGVVRDYFFSHDRTLINGTTQRVKTRVVFRTDDLDCNWFSFDDQPEPANWASVTTAESNAWENNSATLYDDNNWQRGSMSGEHFRFFKHDTDDSFFVTHNNQVIAIGLPNGSWLEQGYHVYQSQNRIERHIPMADQCLRWGGQESVSMWPLRTTWEVVDNPIQALTDLGGIGCTHPAWFGYSADIKWKWQPATQNLNTTGLLGPALNAGIVKVGNDYYVDTDAGSPDGMLFNCGTSLPVIS